MIVHDDYDDYLDMPSAFDEIRQQDPNGQSDKPTDDDYARFKRWVVETYGADIYCAYAHSFVDGECSCGNVHYQP